MLVLVATARVAFHVSTNGQYGFHRDELQTLDDAHHLDWGFVVYPPVTPVIARLELLLCGPSLIGFRFFAAVVVSAIMVLTGLSAKELGGTRYIQPLAAVAAGISSPLFHWHRAPSSNTSPSTISGVLLLPTFWCGW